MPKPLELKTDDFAKEVLEEEVPVLVDFWSHTCPHCLQLNPHFEKAAEADDGHCKFVKISVQDNAMPLFQQHGVSGVPTLILFHGGKEVARRVGSTTSDQIAAWIKEHI